MTTFSPNPFDAPTSPSDRRPAPFGPPAEGPRPMVASASEHREDAGLRPSAAFVGASWTALLTGTVAYLTGLYNARMELSDKGFYLTLLLFGLFAAVSLQKAVRDRDESVPVSALFLGLAWASVATVITLLSVGLWNADLLRSEKGFYAMSFLLSMFAAVAVQKNVRDLAATRRPELDD